jgi:hypothetical protein
MATNQPSPMERKRFAIVAASGVKSQTTTQRLAKNRRIINQQAGVDELDGSPRAGFFNRNPQVTKGQTSHRTEKRRNSHFPLMTEAYREIAKQHRLCPCISAFVCKYASLRLSGSTRNARLSATTKRLKKLKLLIDHVFKANLYH